MPSNGARTTVCSRSSVGRVAHRLRGEIGGLLGDGPIEVAAQARADLVERALGRPESLGSRRRACGALSSTSTSDASLRSASAVEPVELALARTRRSCGRARAARAPAGTTRACPRRSRRSRRAARRRDRAFDLERPVVDREQHVARFDALVLAHASTATIGPAICALTMPTSALTYALSVSTTRPDV